MENSIDQLNSQLNTVLRPLFDNKTFVAGLALFFGLYAVRLAPKLPNSMISFFDTTLGKFLLIFVLAFVASRDLPNTMNISLLIAFIFVLALTTFNSSKLQEQFKYLGSEHFATMNTFNEQSNNKTTVFPLIETLEHEIADMMAK
jgi:hypothetical protein